LSLRVVAPRPGAKPEPVSRRLVRTLTHTNRQALIGTVLFAPDGKWIAGCGLYGTGGLQVWDTTTGKQLRNVSIPEGYRSQYDPLPAAPDGHTLYVPLVRERSIRTTKDGHPTVLQEVDGEIQVWDLATGRRRPPLRPTPPGGVVGVALSADGNWLGAVERRVTDERTRTRDVLTLWDVRARTARDLTAAQRYKVPRFAPDGKTLAAPFVNAESRRKALALWDVPGGKRRAILHSGADYYGEPAFSPDGRFVATDLSRPKARAPEVKVWEVASGKEVVTFAGPEKATGFHHLAFSPDGRRLAAVTYEAGQVVLYDVPGRKLVRVEDLGKNAMLRRPAFSPDGKWLAVPGQPLPEGARRVADESPLNLPQPRVFLFDLAAGGEPEVVVAPHGLAGRAAFSPDGRALALGGTGCVWLFNLLKGP
jgi:WD40 repeat protein